MLNVYNVFDNDPVEVVKRDMVPPITTEELLDQSNPLPRQLAPAVTSATDYIQQHISEEKKRAADQEADTLDKKIMAARGGQNTDNVAAQLDDLVVAWNRGSNRGFTGPELRWIRARVQDYFLGYDAVEPLMRDPRVTEILIGAAQPRLVKTPDGNGGIREQWDGGTRIEIGGTLTAAPGVVFGSDDDVLTLASQTLLPRTPPTIAEPIQSGMLENKTRVEVRHRIVGNGDTFVALRRHPLSAWTLQMLIDNGTITEELACDLATWKRDRYNLLIAGGTSSGKTTLTNGLLGFVDPAHHLIIIEDTPELNPPGFVFATRATTRPSRGTMKDVTQNDLMRSSLRSRPEILAIGEARGGELVEVLKAQRTGHHGSFTTLHADSAADSIIRMKDMLAETSEGTTGSLDHKIASAIDIIIFQKRLEDGRRRVTEVIEIRKPDATSTREIDTVEFTHLYRYDPNTDTQVRVGEVSPELKAIRGVPASRAPLTMRDVAIAHELTHG